MSKPDAQTSKPAETEQDSLGEQKPSNGGLNQTATMKKSALYVNEVSQTSLTQSCHGQERSLSDTIQRSENEDSSDKLSVRNNLPLWSVSEPSSLLSLNSDLSMCQSTTGSYRTSSVNEDLQVP